MVSTVAEAIRATEARADISVALGTERGRLGALGTGQAAGLITELKPARWIVREIVEEAETIIQQRLTTLTDQPQAARSSAS